MYLANANVKINKKSTKVDKRKEKYMEKLKQRLPYESPSVETLLFFERDVIATSGEAGNEGTSAEGGTMIGGAWDT